VLRGAQFLEILRRRRRRNTRVPLPPAKTCRWARPEPLPKRAV